MLTLKGGEGGLQIEVNSRGQQVRLLSFKAPTRGKDITLTIDAKIQQIAMESLDGAKGSIVIMDMDNGEILGMISSPTYNPGIFVDGGKQRQLSALLSQTSAPLLNRAIKGLFPPGSVFKIPFLINFIEAGLTLDPPFLI